MQRAPPQYPPQNDDDVDFGTCNPKDDGVTDTTNGLCGATWGTTCAGYGDKKCCSEYGYWYVSTHEDGLKRQCH